MFSPASVCIINANPAGTTFCLAAGTYIGQVVVPKSGNQFIGTAGKQQTHLDGHGVAASFLDSLTAKDVRVNGLDIYGYEPARYGAIDDRHDTDAGSSGWIVEQSDIHDIRGGGLAINIGSGSTIRYNRIFHNGRHALVGGGISSRVIANEIYDNNIDNFDCGVSCVTKFVLSQHLLVQGNYVHDNNGPGLWDDIGNDDITYDSNLIVNNAQEGIFHEIGYRAIIKNNSLVNNGWGRFEWVYGGQIMLSSSQGSEVYGNWVQVGPKTTNAITVADQTRNPGGFDNSVHDNTITDPLRIGQSGAAYDGHDSARDKRIYLSNHFDSNYYHLGSCSDQHWTWNNASLNFSNFKVAGQEANGTCDTTIRPFDLQKAESMSGLNYPMSGSVSDTPSSVSDTPSSVTGRQGRRHRRG